MKKMFFLLFILFFQYSNLYIVLPFKINKYTPKIEGKTNITELINEYLVHDMFTTIEVGTGSSIQKVTTLITPDESLLSLSSNICKRKSLDAIDDFSIVSKTGLDISLYGSHIIDKNYTNYLDDDNKIGVITDSISMYNTTYLGCQPIEIDNRKEKDTKLSVSNVSIPIKEKDKNNNEKLCAILGIGSPQNIKKELQDMGSFINYLKKRNVIDDYSWTIKFHTRSEGRLIIGGLPHTYEQNTKYYNEGKYKRMTTYSPNDIDHPWSFHFKEITFINSNNETIYVGKWIKMILVPNIGFIIGENKYKNLILENYFKGLIVRNICVLEKTNITKYTKDEIFFGTSGIYEIFHCDKDLNKEKLVFPKLSFVIPDLDYIFNFTFNNLFEEIDERYYFLVIFPEDTRQAAYNVWYLGLPFYYDNKFIFNYDSKTIGIYDQNMKEKSDDDNKKKDEENNKETSESTENNSKSNVWRIIIEIIVGILLVVIAFYIGKKINEHRKKRANELTDNYDYTAEENTEDNLIQNNNPGKNSGLGFQ